MSIQYRGDDGRIHSLGDNDSLQHWKYIKKIQTGSGPRYFYTMEELRSYYNDAKKNLSPKAFQDRAKKDWKDEIDRHDRTIEPLRRRKLEMINRQGSNYSFQRRLDYNSNEKAIASENRRHEAERSKINKRIKRADKYKEISDDAKDRTKSVTKRISDIKNSGSKTIEKGRSKVEKKLNKAKKTAKSEAKGVKRASNAIRGKGNNFYDAHDTAPKSYSSYDKKKKKFGKNKKTGRAERAMIYAYRRTHPNE